MDRLMTADEAAFRDAVEAEMERMATDCVKNSIAPGPETTFMGAV